MGSEGLVCPLRKRLPNQKWLFWRSSHLPQSADTQASPDFEKVQISSSIDALYEDDTFRSGHTSVSLNTQFNLFFCTISTSSKALRGFVYARFSVIRLAQNNGVFTVHLLMKRDT